MADEKLKQELRAEIYQYLKGSEAYQDGSAKMAVSALEAIFDAYHERLIARERLEARLEVVRRARGKHGRDAWGTEEENLERELSKLDAQAKQEEGVKREDCHS